MYENIRVPPPPGGIYLYTSTLYCLAVMASFYSVVVEAGCYSDMVESSHLGSIPGRDRLK